MKKLFLLVFLLSSSTFLFAQDDEQPVYKRFPSIPQFTVYTAPDSVAFSKDNLKKKTTIFFIFSPECGHCKHETQLMLDNIKKFRNTQIVMITHFPFAEMMQFYKDFRIAHYPQITMARDTRYFFPVFFKVENFPSLFVYDKKGNFKKSFEGSVKMDDLLGSL